jgi:hypothetical protein
MWSAKSYDNEEDASGGVWRGVQPRSKIPADVVQQAANNQVRELRDNQTSDERTPVVLWQVVSE